ncbi:prephenate dehydrogenase [Shewanella sp. Isolate11]|uniref:prephenate dehydrogenase n=1 Tax=Shewanella sp. Isolate11 TaxID=2908530 RepID=UPI001EFE7472|nr:prephenate dehydrogenase [Shewanella sp. Isolate11]MCG9695522.1 prephenate dehydrogenase [Shewanella sp. Isolate11]
MPHSQLTQQLKETLQLAYRQAIDADNKLDELKKAGHGKFSTIFTQEEGFDARSNRFSPYVQELAQEMTQLPSEGEALAPALEKLVRKLGVLLQTLQTFKSQTK